MGTVEDGRGTVELIDRRTDRSEEITPVDIVCPPDEEIYSSSYVYKCLKFTIDRKIDKLKNATELVISSTEDSTKKEDALRNLADLIIYAFVCVSICVDQILTTDTRLADHIDSRVIPHLVEFLKDNKQLSEEDEIMFKYYSTLILTRIVYSKNGTLFKYDAIQPLFNLVPSPNKYLQMHALVALTDIACAFRDACDSMIEMGALELLDSLLTDAYAHFQVLDCGGGLLVAFCKMNPPLLSIKINFVIDTITKALHRDNESVSALIPVCLALSILSDRRLVPIATQVQRLIELIGYGTYEIVISALRTIGNYVRWGNDEEIELMMEGEDLMLCLLKMLYYKYAVVRKEASWIISNINAVANKSQLQKVIDYCLIDIVVELIKDDFDVKEVAACAILNAISSSDEKQFKSLKRICFPRLRFYSFCEPRIVDLCSKILESKKVTEDSDSKKIVREKGSMSTKVRSLDLSHYAT